MIGDIRELGRDRTGIGAMKFSFVTCLFAIAVASLFPTLKSAPQMGTTAMELREHLPTALREAAKAMRQD